MTESLRHKELKEEAVRKLKEIGFKEDEIKKEQWVSYSWEEKSWKKRIDVIGNNNNKKVLFQVGNHSDAEIIILKKYFELYYLPYPEEKEENIFKEGEKTLKEKQKELINVYNEFEKFFEGDEVYDFIKYTEGNNVFKISKFEPWMILPTSQVLTKKELFNEITLTMDYLNENRFAFGIYAIQKPAVKKFLAFPNGEKEKYIQEINKLPDGYYVFDGYRKPIHHWSHYRNYWYEERYSANRFNYSQLEEMENTAQQLIDFNGKELPCLCLLYIEIDRKDIIRALRQIKPVYKILKTLKTVERETIEKIKTLSQWEWHAYENHIKDLYDIFISKFPEIKIDYGEFRSLVRKLKIEDPDYLKYAEK